MNFPTLVLRGLRHHWRDHLGVLLGTAVGAAVLTGALLVGDSARHTLHRGALLRLGRAVLALPTEGGSVSAALGDRLRERLGVPVAPLLHERAIAVVAGAGGRRQAGRVQIYGVDARFAEFVPSDGDPARAPRPGAGEIALGRALAAALGAGPGDRVSLRLASPTRLPRDAPLAEAGDNATILAAVTVSAIVPEEALGGFGLGSAMRSPRNGFVDLGWLQRTLGREGSANLFLVGEGPGGPALEEASRALREAVRPGMAGLSLRAEAGLSLVESQRIFLEPAVSSAVMGVPGAVGALTYLVNRIERVGAEGARGTPYSFVTALSPSGDAALGPVPAGMRDDEILLNRWAADRLGARTGDRVTLSYSAALPAGGFEERRRPFTVRDVLPMERIADERRYLPEFPGLTDVESCRDWSIGLPLDEEAVRDAANEEYWRTYRATPKAFVTLAAGRAMWANRWGDLTAVRLPRGALPDGLDSLAARLPPETLGLALRPVRAEALRSAGEATDLGGLFLGMSLFLVVASLVLTGLLFAFGVERRAGENGTLLALGFTPARVAALQFAEAGLAACAGAAAGAAAGSWYARALLAGLRTSWSDAVAGLEIVPHAEPWTVPVGAAAALAAAGAALALAVRRQAQVPAAELIAAGGTAVPDPAAAGRPHIAASAAAAIAALALAARAAAGGGEAAPAFFSAGSLLLLSALLAARWALRRMDRPAPARLTAVALCVRGIARRPGRSLAVIALLASGGFIVFAVSAMSPGAGAPAGRASGSGGFALVGESGLPLQRGAVVEAARRAVPGRRENDVLTLKVRGGDDATCLNLNRAGAPPLVGVEPEEFARRGAFVPEGKGRGAWDLLARDLPQGMVPGLVGDEDTARWNLRVKTGPDGGDEIEYRDERGEPFRVRLVGSLPARKSVFQGMVLIPVGEFVRRFPSEEGFRMVLLDAPPERADALRDALGSDLGRLGLELRTPAERLAEFYAVEHAYQAMFLALGALGMLLGTAGLAVVVLRNVLERRAELALLTAVGARRGWIVGLLFGEHTALFAAGIAAGVIPALVAVSPALRSPGARIPIGDLAWTALALAAAGVTCTLLAAVSSMRGPIVPALRRE